MESLAEVRLVREDGEADAGAAWNRLAAFGERVTRAPPEASRERVVPVSALRTDEARPGLEPGSLERVAPEFRNGLLLVPRVL